MDKQPTFGQIATLLSIIVIPLMIWGVNVERRFETVIKNSEEIKALKTTLNNYIRDSNENHIEIMEQLHNIELQLKDKKNRD